MLAHLGLRHRPVLTACFTGAVFGQRERLLKVCELLGAEKNRGRLPMIGERELDVVRRDENSGPPRP